MDERELLLQASLAALKTLVETARTITEGDAWLDPSAPVDSAEACKRRIFEAAMAELNFNEQTGPKPSAQELWALAQQAKAHLVNSSDTALFASLLSATIGVRVASETSHLTDDGRFRSQS